MQPDSFVLTSQSQAEFYRHQPVDFFLYDEEGNANLYILNDNVPGKAHNLILINESEQDLTLTGNRSLPEKDNYHFELRFRPGTIDPNFHNWVTVGSGEWLLKSKLWQGDAQIADGTVSLYLVYQFESELTLPFRSSRLIPLHGLKSGSGGGSRGSRAELRYNLNGNQIVANSTAALHFRQERLEIINQRGVRDIPLEAGFALGNRVLNNGDEENELSLQITNLLRNSYVPFQGKYSEAPTRLVLSFDTSEAVQYWALFDEDNALGVLVDVSGTNTFWHIEKEVQGQTTQWILSPSEEIELDAGVSFRINLSKVISAMPTGSANLYLQYENMPGYWDDLFVVPIEKTPFYLEDKQDALGNVMKTIVGVGTHTVDQDGATVQIVGGLSADSLAVSNPSGAGVIPRGGIIMWSGAVADVPVGWNICDGNGGEKIGDLDIPDLRSRFIVGVGQGDGLSNYAPGVGDDRGKESHLLSGTETPSHSHSATITDTTKSPINSISDAAFNIDTGEAEVEGQVTINATTIDIKEANSVAIITTPVAATTAHENRPPYYALAFIIKL